MFCLAHYSIKIKIKRPMTLSLARGSSLLGYGSGDASVTFRYVVEFFTSKQMLPLFLAAPFKMQYIQFVSIILDVDPNREPSDNYEAFRTNGNGYRKLWLKRHWKRDHLDMLMREGIAHSIVSGCWIDSRASSILANGPGNRVSCRMIDTTWTILRRYVTAIFLAVSRSADISFAFAFGPIESAEFYELF
jgi:hypothetical protein